MPKKKTKKKAFDSFEKVARERLDEKKVEAGLQAIYGSEKVSMEKLDRGQNKIIRVLSRIVIVLAVISALGWTSFIAYQAMQPSTQLDAFNLEIISSEEVASGEITTLTFKYYYPDSLADLEIDINLPKNFILRETSLPPTNEDDLIWDLGSQVQGQPGEIVVTGKWLTRVPSETSVQAFARYKPLNVNAELEAVSSKVIRTTSSVADIEYMGPKEVTAGETIELVFEIKNNSDESLPTSEFAINLPQNFFLQRSNPVANEEGVWRIETIEPRQAFRVVMNGAFSSETSDLEELGYELYFLNDETSLTQVDEAIYFDVIASELQSSLLINGQSDLVIVSPGDDLDASIILENGLDTSVSNASVLLDFQSEKRMPVSWSASDLNGARITSEGILWSNELIGEIASGSREVLRAVFPVENSLSQNDTNEMTVTARTFIQSREIRSRRLQILIGNQPSVTTEEVDDGLTYKVDSGVSGLSGVRLEFSIDDPNFRPDVSIGKINNFAGTLIWSIEEMEPNQSASINFPRSLVIESTEFSANYPQTLTPVTLD